MKALKLLAAGSMTGLLAACASGPTVKGDYDHQADFAQYRSFGFMSPLGTDRAGYSTLLTERLKTATRGQMEMRGYVYSAWVACPAGKTLIMRALTSCTGTSKNVYQYCKCDQSGNSLRAGYLSSSASANANYTTVCEGLCVM